MSIVRYPDKLPVIDMSGSFAPGLSNRTAGRTFLEAGDNKASLHFAATITAPENARLIMPAGSIPAKHAPPYAERGFCVMNGELVIVIVGTTGNVTIDFESPRTLTGNTWIIGVIEWMRRPA